MTTGHVHQPTETTDLSSYCHGCGQVLRIVDISPYDWIERTPILVWLTRDEETYVKASQAST